MLDDVLARKLEEPELDLSGDELVGCVLRLVELNGMDQ